MRNIIKQPYFYWSFIDNYFEKLVQIRMSRRNSIARTKARIRRDSGTQLDYYYKIVNKTILTNQVCLFLTYLCKNNQNF